jgi:hypothetical protein
MKQGDWTVIPLFAALGKTAEKVVAEDTFFIESYTFMAKPQVRWEHGAVTYRVFAGAKRAINKETRDEAWSEGRYDYEEFGLGLGAARKAPWAFLGELKASLEYLHRTYMNFHELATVENKNYYSKDYDGWKLSLDTEGSKEAALPWTFGYTLLLKNYTDNYLETDQLKPDVHEGLRRDQLHRLEGGLQGLLGKQWAWGADLGYDLNISNQNYRDPAFTAKKDFNVDFYGYYAETLGGKLTWMPRGPEGPSLTPSYSLTLRNYTGRRIRNFDGSFTDGTQADTEHDLGLNGRWPLQKWAALTGGMEFYSVQSNQAFVLRMMNSFDVFKAKLGVDLSY